MFETYQALQELGDLISDDLKIKCMHACDEAYHKQVLAATETLKFKFKIKIVKITTKEFRQYFVENLSVKGIGEVGRGILVGYKPCLSQNSASTVSRIVANPTPYSFLTISELKKPRKKVSRKKIHTILEFNPSDNCRKLGKGKDEKAWNRPMPYNEKLRRASTNAEVREIAENFSNLSKWMIIKDRFRKGAKPLPRIVITEEWRKIEDIRIPQIHDLYSRDYGVRTRPRDIRLAELARKSGGTLHLSGHNIKVQTSSRPDDDHKSYKFRSRNLPSPPFCTLK
ncbi:uncharacterized protein LOC111710117 isoform X2 [Eurytemora carolleeae]|uniref:uncharacterized protein LOC111710117 isoform X2 n=1 Tax=Eurytemora carolleeae TaxID=1294199 RepID=UPI000C75A0C7|nr:uncharacterized protein LOC111710117 isoform X2 [Eurytemora carolleeae]|eukprot:XP_023339918.1 uncharacterized protein LOC111710117 isoform X2 [Eurytemora affinis]